MVTKKNILSWWLIVSLGCTIFYSCQKQDAFEEGTPAAQIESILHPDSAQAAFAKILSKVVYESYDVRNFLKQTALEQFDNDYDVFYPFVKDKVVSDGRTFREVLLAYAEDEASYSSIEEALPLLNIYVPDLTMFTDFNAEVWDINDREIAVTSLSKSDEQVFYEAGHESFTLDITEIPGFPCLVVKNNERLKVKNQIKVKGIVNADSYEFVDDAFDRQLNSKYISNYISFDPTLGKAYEEFGVDPQYWQRDYIYFGMTKSLNKNGEYNPQIREYIESIKINPQHLSVIADQSNDPKITPFNHKSNDSNPLSYTEIFNRIWSEGNFEIVFTVLKGNSESGNVNKEVKTVSIAPKDLFTITHVNHTVDKRGWFHRDVHTYSVSPENIEGKSYRFLSGPGLALEQWNIAKESSTIHMIIEERDDSETIEQTLSVKNTYANNKNFKFDLGLGEIVEWIVKLDLSFGFSSQKSEEKNETVKVTTTKTSDNLGTLTFYFSDPVIEKKVQPNQNQYHYEFYKNSTGAVEIELVPQKLGR